MKVTIHIIGYFSYYTLFSTAARLVRAHLEFCKSRGQTLIFAVLEA